MDYQHFKALVPKLKEASLPGLAAQVRAAPELKRHHPPSADVLKAARKAAVLAWVENRGEEAHLIFTQRVSYPGVHSGQISFPGGKREEEDPDFIGTALRETEEEIGLRPQEGELITGLSQLYIPPSDFLVHPYLAFSDRALDLRRQESEVAQIHRVALTELLNPSSLKPVEVAASGQRRMKVPAYVVKDLVIWGATAMILAEILALIEAAQAASD